MAALVAGCRAVRLSMVGAADRAGAGKSATRAGGRDGGRQSREGRGGGRAGSGWVAQSSAAASSGRGLSGGYGAVGDAISCGEMGRRTVTDVVVDRLRSKRKKKEDGRKEECRGGRKRKRGDGGGPHPYAYANEGPLAALLLYVWSGRSHTYTVLLRRPTKPTNFHIKVHS